MTFVHQRLGYALLAVLLVACVLALFARGRPQLTATLRVYSYLCVAAVGVQVLIGLVLFVTGSRPGQAIHWFYGAATFLALPISLQVARRDSGREMLLIGLGALAAALFAFRCITTGTAG